MKESDLQSFTLAAMKCAGIFHWRVANGAVMHTIGKRIIRKKSPIAGFPDIAGVCPSGRFFALELKAEKGKVAPHQQEWIDTLSEANALVAVAKTVTEVLDFIKLIKTT